MSTTVVLADGFTFQDFPIPDRTKPPSIVHAEDVETGHVVNLDVTNNNLDSAHLVLRGNLPLGHFYLKCENQSDVNQLTIDRNGGVDCNAVSLPAIGDVESEIQGNPQLIATNTTNRQITHKEM